MNLNQLLVLLWVVSFTSLSAQEKEVLVFHKTEGFHHKSIETGYKAIQELGEENKFRVTETDNSKEFSDENLEKYQLVIFLNTTGNVLNEEQEKAFENFMNNGGSFFGIHSAADTEYEWEWYGDLVGAYFESHPKISEATIEVVDPDHPAVAHFPNTFQRTDEWYNYKSINPEIKVLLKLDETSYEGGKNGENHPIAWYQKTKGGGTAIYTGGGHTVESYSEPLFREHLRQCILYALGTNGLIPQ